MVNDDKNPTTLTPNLSMMESSASREDVAVGEAGLLPTVVRFPPERSFHGILDQ